MSSNGGFYRILEWLVRFVYINMLWIGFSLAGLILFGFFPATVSLFAVTRKWLNGQKEIAIFSYFLKTFKESFFQANLIFYLMAGFGYSLYFYGQIIQSLNGITYMAASTVWISIIIIFSVLLLYLFPAYVHFNLPTFMYFKYAFLIGITSPVQTLLMLLNSIAIILFFLSIPTLIPFFFGSFLSFTLMWISLRAFKKVNGNFSNQA